MVGEKEQAKKMQEVSKLLGYFMENIRKEIRKKGKERARLEKEKKEEKLRHPEEQDLLQKILENLEIRQRRLVKIVEGLEGLEAHHQRENQDKYEITRKNMCLN